VVPAESSIVRVVVLSERASAVYAICLHSDD
jgi:hypothetical protein